MSYEKQKTSADIIAEMRYGTIPKHRTDHELLASYSDRIEAAYKREIAALEAERDQWHKQALPVGNAAKMRDVMERLAVLNLNVLKYPLDGDSSKIYDADKKPITLPAWGVATLLNGAKEIQVAARAALAEQPRNCDKSRDYILAALKREKNIDPTFTVRMVVDFMLANTKQ